MPILLFTAAALAGAAAIPPDLAAAVRAYDAAQVASDGMALKRLLADDYLLVNSRGQIETKAAFIAEQTAPGYRLDPFVVEQPIVQVWAGGAVLGGIATLSGTEGGKSYRVRLRFADIWAKRDGRWQVIHTEARRAD